MLQKEEVYCKKCKTSKPYIVVQKDPVCKECFIGHVEHMFKMTLRLKCNITKKNEKLLILFSGGQNSTVLAKLTGDVVHSTCAHNKSKMFIEADVLYINESFIMKEFIQDYAVQDYSNFIKQECKLNFIEVPIESIYPDSAILIKQLRSLPEYGNAREDFIRFIKQHIIYDIAINKGYSQICYGQNGQRLAADLFSQLSKGKGLSLLTATKYQSQFIYPINNAQINILHPLKELMNKEILYYIKLKQTELFPIFRLDQHISQNIKNKPSNGNIDHLLEEFIDKLQQGFPSTTFTVLSSAEKITLKPQEQKTICPICLQQRDQIYNRLEVETLDFSNQQLLNHLKTNTKYFHKFCFSCNRIFQRAEDIENYYNLKGFPPIIIRIADIV